MEDIQVNRIELINIAKENYKEYETLYKDAVVVYDELLIDLKKKTLKAFRAENKAYALEQFSLINEGKESSSYRSALSLQKYNKFVVQNKPIDHTEEFQESIDMLELDTREDIDLTREEYKEYVKNEWPFFQEELRKANNISLMYSGNIGIGTDSPSGVMGLTGATGSTGPQGAVGRSNTRMLETFRKYS